MAKPKTFETQAAPDGYLAAIADEERRNDCLALLDLMARASKQEAKMWGTAIVGFGVHKYPLAGGKTGDQFWSLIRELDVTVLPNTAGCRSVREAVTTAKLARELFGTSWIKLEVIADNDTLQPDVVGLVEAAAILIKDGFEVFPYCTEDLSVAMRLVDAGCKVVMPWAAPIGSAKGITNRDALRLLRDRLPDITLVVDAGIGAPSHAAQALELGYDAVLLNTAIAKADDPVKMGHAFRLAAEAGRSGFEAGLMGARDFASPSTPVVGTPFWHAVS